MILDACVLISLKKPIDVFDMACAEARLFCNPYRILKEWVAASGIIYAIEADVNTNEVN